MLEHSFKLSFHDTPWTHFFQLVTQGDSADFTQAGRPFPFYQKHPKPSLLWETFMLLDLHQHLKEQLQHKNLTWENAFPTPTSTITANTMTNLSELEKRVSELTTTDKTAEPELTPSLRDEIHHQHSKKAKATRF